MEKTSLPISLDRGKGIERDDFFRKGGNYKYRMNDKTSTVDLATVQHNKDLVQEYHHRIVDEHHETTLLSKHEEYKKRYLELYETDHKPNKNKQVRAKQSIYDQADELDPLHPSKNGYQFSAN